MPKDLEFIRKKLAYSTRAGKPLDQYPNNNKSMLNNMNRVRKEDSNIVRTKEMQICLEIIDDLYRKYPSPSEDLIKSAIAEDQTFHYWKIKPTQEEYTINQYVAKHAATMLFNDLPELIREVREGKKIMITKNVTSLYPDRYEINLQKYKQDLFNNIYPILDAYGINVIALAEEFGLNPLTEKDLEPERGDIE